MTEKEGGRYSRDRQKGSREYRREEFGTRTSNQKLKGNMVRDVGNQTENAQGRENSSLIGIRVVSHSCIFGALEHLHFTCTVSRYSVTEISFGISCCSHLQ